MSRFKPGDPVQVIPTEGSLFAGVQGIVEQVKVNPRKLTQLDSYTVRFSWGETQAFWDAQLESAEEKKAAGPESSEVV